MSGAAWNQCAPAETASAPDRARIHAPPPTARPTGPRRMPPAPPSIVLAVKQSIHCSKGNCPPRCTRWLSRAKASRRTAARAVRGPRLEQQRTRCNRNPFPATWVECRTARCALRSQAEPRALRLQRSDPRPGSDGRPAERSAIHPTPELRHDTGGGDRRAVFRPTGSSKSCTLAWRHPVRQIPRPS
jgi:hypothetical protein